MEHVGSKETLEKNKTLILVDREYVERTPSWHITHRATDHTERRVGSLSGSGPASGNKEPGLTPKRRPRLLPPTEKGIRADPSVRHPRKKGQSPSPERQDELSYRDNLSHFLKIRC